MISDAFVIDAVSHAFNLLPDNLVFPEARLVSDSVRRLHGRWNPPWLRVPEAMIDSDWPVEALAETLFLESDVDVAVHHHLPLYSWFRDGIVSVEKNIELMARWPQRFLIYAGVSPQEGLDASIKRLEDQVRAVPTTIGLKLYPTQVNPLASISMDDEELMFPLYEKCRELGIRVIAIHKALPTGPVPINPFKIDDVGGAAAAFPDLSFEIIHGGLAFLDETAQSIANFPNVYVNLEVTGILLMAGPAWFNEILANLIFWGGVEKIIWSGSSMYSHPQPQLERFWSLDLPPEIQDKYSIATLTKEDKAAILGGNFARMAGLEIEDLKAKIAGDEFSLRRAEMGGPDEPYSHWKAISRKAGLIQ